MTTHAPPSTGSFDAPTRTSGFKRRRLSSQKNKEELAYTASTIQKKAYIQGDRREHALLPIGCGVDMSTVKLVTAAEYDDDRWSSSGNSDEGQQLQSNQLQEQQGQQEENCKCKDETGESSSSSNSNNMNDAAVIEMQMYANLVTSTRQLYYTDTLALATKSTSKRRPTATSNRTATTNSNLRSSSPNSSEGNSTWSQSSLLEDTTTTLNDFNANHTKKNIDNDNRSDGQSSNMGNCGWYSSDDSGSSSSSDNDDDDEKESKKYKVNEEVEIRQQCDEGHQQVQEQQRGHDNDKVDSSSSRLHCLVEPYSVVG